MWSVSELNTLSCILDELIPTSEDGNIPGAGSVVSAEFLRTASDFATDPVGAIEIILACVARKSKDIAALDRSERLQILQAVEAEVPDSFALLVRLTYMGYYSRPEIRPLFGLASHPIHPQGYSVPNESSEFIASLTKPVRQRGRFYRSP